LSLAYDPYNYCFLAVPPTSCTPNSISTGGQIVPPGSQINFFQGSGTPPPQGIGEGTVSPFCSGNPHQTGAIGNCQYLNNIDGTHGQH